MRIRAKRARVRRRGGGPGHPRRRRRSPPRSADLQGVLGDQHDAVVAEEWLRDAVVAGHEPAAGVRGRPPGRAAEREPTARAPTARRWRGRPGRRPGERKKLRRRGCATRRWPRPEVRAAGGVVWRVRPDDGRGVEVLVVHRPRLRRLDASRRASSTPTTSTTSTPRRARGGGGDRPDGARLGRELPGTTTRSPRAAPSTCGTGRCGSLATGRRRSSPTPRSTSCRWLDSRPPPRRRCCTYAPRPRRCSPPLDRSCGGVRAVASAARAACHSALLAVPGEAISRHAFPARRSPLVHRPPEPVHLASLALRDVFPTQRRRTA